MLHQKAASDPQLREAFASIAAAGVGLEVRVTDGAGDAVKLAESAARSGAEIVVAGGGDGTINEVATGLMQAREQGIRLPRLAILPLGTANDFARSAGIPLEPLEALQLLSSGRAHRIDVGTVDERYFLNVATGGFTSEVTAETPQALKHLFGSVAYLLTGLTKPSSVSARHGRIRGPSFTWEGEFMALAVGNGRQAGGGFVLTPDATIDDGLLDVAVLPQSDDVGFLEALKVLRESGLSAIEEWVLRWRTPWLDIDAPEVLCINLDGEPARTARYRFDLQPSALELLLPPDSPLLSKNGG